MGRSVLPDTNRSVRGAFLADPDDDLDTLCNVDASVELADGSRWSATIFTVDEVKRLLARWAATGEDTAGTYIHCAL